VVAALIVGSLIILVCITSGQFIHRFGIPALIIFLVLGVLAEALPLDMLPLNPHYAERIGEVALIFIIFYGGFGTNWKAAKPVVGRAGVLASLGVCITALAVTLFMHFVFGINWIESYLIGAVISCTDAASVFSVLRTRKMNLKHNTVPVLELESGCNDPTSYLLTMIGLLVLSSLGSGQSPDTFALVIDIIVLAGKQIIIGVAAGVGVAFISVRLIKRLSKHFADGMDLVFVLATAVFSYAIAALFEGNGYLAAFLCGIILGNSAIPSKVRMAHFFDSIDWLSQITIFFLFGLIVAPDHLIAAALPAAALTLFLLFVARPLAVLLIFKPLGAPLKQCSLISWVGLRGAASLVFAVMATTGGNIGGIPVMDGALTSDLFHIVILTAFFSIALQGTLIKKAAERLNMIDTETDVMRSFTDYQEQSPKVYMKMHIDSHHPWVGTAIKDLVLGHESLIVLIKRGAQAIAPKGNTVIMPDDIMVVSGESYEEEDSTQINQVEIDAKSPWANRLVSELDISENTLIVGVQKADGTTVTPKGGTRLQPGDLVTVFTWEDSILF
jgi:cell volume regulation protein A